MANNCPKLPINIKSQNPKNKNSTHPDKDVEKGESMYTVGGNVSWCSYAATMEKSVVVPQKTKNRISI